MFCFSGVWVLGFLLFLLDLFRFQRPSLKTTVQRAVTSFQKLFLKQYICSFSLSKQATVDKAKKNQEVKLSSPSASWSWVPLSKAFIPSLPETSCAEVNNVGLWFTAGRSEVWMCVGAWIWNSVLREQKKEKKRKHARPLQHFLKKHVLQKYNCNIICDIYTHTLTCNFGFSPDLKWNSSRVRWSLSECTPSSGFISESWKWAAGRAEASRPASCCRAWHMAVRSRDRLHFHPTAKSVYQTRKGIWDTTNCSLVCVQTLTKDIIYMGDIK